jgi:predicted lactoylglutathione lyase
LHHFAIELENRAQIHKAFEKVKKLGCIVLDEPQLFPDYGDAYYAFYFLDLDGLKQEFVTFNS